MPYHGVMSRNAYAKLVRSLRESRRYSQSEVAKKIGVSRSSYIAVEQGRREFDFKEARNFVALFDITFEDLASGKVSEIPQISIKRMPKSKATPMETKSLRISVPQEKIELFKKVLTYILYKVGGKPNVGKTVLYKILYFIDFDYYEKYEEQFIGATYKKLPQGPAPVVFDEVISQLFSEGKIDAIKSKFYQYEQKKYLVNPDIEPDLQGITADQLAHIDYELERLSDMTATEISNLSHEDMPWRVAKPRESLDYEMVFYREDKLAARDYEEL